MSLPNQNNQILLNQTVVVNGQSQSPNPIEMMRILHLAKEQKSIRCSMRWLLILELIIQIVTAVIENDVCPLITIGLTFLNCCMTCFTNCLNNMCYTVVIIVMCLIRLVMYVIIAIIITKCYSWTAYFLPGSSAVIVMIYLGQYYRVVKIEKQLFPSPESTINQPLLTTNNEAVPQQIIQVPPQPQLQPPQSQFQPQIPVKYDNPNEVLYPGPEMGVDV